MKHKYDQGCRPFLLLPVKNGIGNAVHSSGKAWLAPDSIHGARSEPKPCSHLAITSTGIQKQLPLLETAQHKNTMHDKRVVGKQGPDLALLLCFHQDQGPCPIGKGSTHDHRPVGKEPVHKGSMFRPIGLFAYRFAQDPGWAWSPKDHEGVLHSLPLSVQLLGSQTQCISVPVKRLPGLQPTSPVCRSSIRSNADRYDPDSSRLIFLLSVFGLYLLIKDTIVSN